MAKLASYFSKADRKKLFFDYLKLVGVLEIIIFLVVVLWAADDKYRQAPAGYPWREYMFVAFAFPIVLTFLMGLIITGFNYFLGEEEFPEREDPAGNLEAVIHQIRRLPFLGILFLLLLTIFALYNLNFIMAWLGALGYNTFLLLCYVLAGLGVIVAVYLVFFLFFKYRLNHKHLQYQYYSQISDKFGLIILDPRTVLYKDGNLLVAGRRFRRARQVGTVPTELLAQEPPPPSLPALKP